MQSIFNFCFSDKTFQIVDRTTQGGGGGSIRTLIFPPAPSPQAGPPPFMRWENLFAPAPSLPLPHYTSLERRRKREIRIYRVVTFPYMNDCIKDLVITQRKTHSEVSLLLKERFPDKKGLSSRSVWRFCLKNGIHLHNRLSNDELEQCTRDVVAVVSKSFLDLSARCSLFSSFSYLHFLVSITVYMSTLQGLKVIFQLLAWICGLLSRPIFFPAVNNKWAISTWIQHSTWFINYNKRKETVNAYETA